METENTITIPLDTYNILIRDQRILDTLYASGIDDWEGHREALRDLFEE